jgi:hypothetical protein
MGATKTGGGCTEWVVLETPKPPRVDDHYRYWTEAPPSLSPRCTYWARQIQRGWRPNRRIRAECYDCSAQWYGIYIWEYINVIQPLIDTYEFDREWRGVVDSTLTINGIARGGIQYRTDL